MPVKFGDMHRNDTNQSGQEELWVCKHAPTLLTDLAVHKKKVEEVSAWCERSFGVGGRKASVSLLIGPTGAGKTITLQVAAKQLNAEVVEWINPVTDANPEPGKSYFWNDQTSERGAYQESQMSKFADFLLRTNRYPSLTIFGNETCDRKLLLVEDFPNAVLQNPKHFHELLRSYHRRGAGPLVFIVSESDSATASERFLFPPDVQNDLRMDIIRFNPIATTSMTKVLSKIANLESRRSTNQVRVPSAESLNQLIVSSAGDIRSAINSLQFFCLNCPLKTSVTKLPSAPTGSSRKRTYGKASKSGSKSVSLSNDETSIGLRDTNLSLFRALGKILYCKREDQQKVEECVVLPEFLSTYRRDPLLMVPEEVVEKSHMSPEGFTAFLHQNYLDFYTNLDDIVSASEYFSDADHFTREWSSRSTLEQYSSSVATRGVLFCNTSRGTVTSATSAVGLGWKPLHKPQWFGTAKKMRENSESVKGLFTGYRLSTDELVMQVLPYLGSICGSGLARNQATVAKEIGKFAKFPVRSQPEKLDEKEFSLPDEDGPDEVRDSESNSQVPAVFLTNSIDGGQNSEHDQHDTQLLIGHNSESDDDFKIEDFDD